MADDELFHPCFTSQSRCVIWLFPVEWLPKLRVSLRHAVLRSRTSDAKARASGYCHTYFDTTKIDALALATFPSANELCSIAEVARNEANSLLGACGVDAVLLRRIGRGRGTLPWILAGCDSVVDEVSSDRDDVSIAASFGDADVLQELLDIMDSPAFLSNATKKQEQRAKTLSLAAASLYADDHIQVCVLILQV
jgi:hypothetical protein